MKAYVWLYLQLSTYNMWANNLFWLTWNDIKILKCHVTPAWLCMEPSGLFRHVVFHERVNKQDFKSAV